MLYVMQDVTYTPVRQIVRRPDLRSPTPEPDSPSVTVNAKIKVLQDEVIHLLVVSCCCL